MMLDLNAAPDLRPLKGNPLDFEELAAAYGERLLRAAWILCRDRHGAEDLVQETFAEAIPAAARFEGRSAPYTWLYGIMRRRLLLQNRKMRRFFRWRSLAEPESETVLPVSFERDVRLDPMMTAVFGLPVKHREVLFLRYIDGRKVADIAEVLGISEGTVKSRLHHALRRAKTAMRSELDAPPTPAAEKAHEL
jgi:RNA polymerase sigma-70 factor, ECF subfamily